MGAARARTSTSNTITRLEGVSIEQTEEAKQPVVANQPDHSL